MTDKPERSDATIVLWIVGGMFGLVAVVGLLAWIAWSLLSPSMTTTRTPVPSPFASAAPTGATPSLPLSSIPDLDEHPYEAVAWEFVDRFFHDGPEAALELATPAFAEQYPLNALEAYRAALVASSGAYMEQDASSRQRSSRSSGGVVESARITHRILFTRVRRDVTVRLRLRPGSSDLLVDGFEVSGGADPLRPAPVLGLAVDDLAQVLLEALAERDHARALEFAARELRWSVRPVDLRAYAGALEAVAGEFSGEPPRRVEEDGGSLERGIAAFDAVFANGTVRLVLDRSPAKGGDVLLGWSIESIDGKPVDLPEPWTAQFRLDQFLTALHDGDLTRARSQCAGRLTGAESLDEMTSRIALVTQRLGAFERRGPAAEVGRTSVDDVARSIRFEVPVTYAEGPASVSIEVSRVEAGPWGISSYEFESPLLRDE